MPGDDALGIDPLGQTDDDSDSIEGLAMMNVSVLPVVVVTVGVSATSGTGG